MKLTSIALASVMALIIGGQAHAEEGKWLIRAGGSYIVPKSDNGSILGGAGQVDIGNRFGPSVNIAYFFTPNWAVDLLGGAPFKHTIRVNGGRAGSAQHLPPILSLQYHFLPESKIRPFVGVGVNYTMLFRSKLDSGDHLALSNSWGPAFQLGVDYALGGGWQVGADLRYARIRSDVRINGAEVGTVAIDPLVYSLNVGYRF